VNEARDDTPLPLKEAEPNTNLRVESKDAAAVENGHQEQR
jgi:hypothetical protein